jgi:flagella basal body P-ring formation protein FlgA
LIPRGKTIAAEDVVEQVGEVSGVPLRRLPIASDVIGARALHDIATGALIAGSAVAMPGAVKSGQTVRAVATVGAVEVTASLVSMQNGQIGDVIRVVNKDSRRELRARVIGEGAVEVIQ